MPQNADQCSHLPLKFLVCRLATEDTREGLASRPARSLGREGLSFRPAERSSFTSSQPRHTLPLTEAEADHPYQQVGPVMRFTQVISLPCCQSCICILSRIPRPFYTA